MLEGNVCNEEQGNTRHQTLGHAQKEWACGEWLEKMFTIRHTFRIAATKIGDDVESLNTLSDICIYHIQLTISH
jgi:hypothetical protein